MTYARTFGVGRWRSQRASSVYAVTGKRRLIAATFAIITTSQLALEFIDIPGDCTHSGPGLLRDRSRLTSNTSMPSVAEGNISQVVEQL